MDRLPNLINIDKQQNIIGIFQGINATETIEDTEFSEMLNLSSDEYPAASSRLPRSAALKAYRNVNGCYYKNGLMVIDGTKLYYKDELIAEDFEDSKKLICGMGAYIVIYPDKKVFNTSTKEITTIEDTWTQSSEATIAPTTEGSTYTVITCTGIGAKFKTGDGVEISGINVATTSGEDVLNGSKIIQGATDDSITIIGQMSESKTQSSGIVVKRKAPDLDYICESDNRLFGCSSANHEIYASALGDPTNWNVFENVSTDSYAVTVGSDGDFTGCIAFMGYVLFFKEESILKLYGTKPSNFQLTTYPYRGVAKDCSDTLTIVNETLYYAARNAVMRYDGAIPESISDKLGDLQNEAGTAGYYDNKYFIWLKDKTAGNALYVYDTRYQMWHRESCDNTEYAVHGDGELYYITDAGKLMKISDSTGTERVNWYAISGKQACGSMNRKRISRLQMMVDAPDDTLFEIFISYDGSPLWERVYTKKDHERSSEEISIAPKKCNYFRYKIKGIGAFKLLGISKTVQIAGAR